MGKYSELHPVYKNGEMRFKVNHTKRMYLGQLDRIINYLLL